MKLKNILLTNAVFLMANAFGAMIFPKFILDLYGVSVDSGVKLMAQYAGIGSVAIGVLALVALKINDLQILIQLVIPILISNGIGVVISLLGTVNGTMNKLGWILVAFYLIFTTGYLIFLFNPDKWNQKGDQPD